MVKSTLLLACGTTTPWASTMSTSTKDRSRPSAVMEARSAVSVKAAAAPAVFTVSVATTVPPLVAFAWSVPVANGTDH